MPSGALTVSSWYSFISRRTAVMAAVACFVATRLAYRSIAPSRGSCSAVTLGKKPGKISESRSRYTSLMFANARL